MVQVYSDPLCRRHYVSVVSAAVVFRILLLVLGIGLSLVIAYATGGFWVKIKATVDQPMVHYTHDALLVFEGRLPGEDMIWSTSTAINEEFRENLLPATVEVGEEDLNFDGKPDIINFMATVQGDMPIYGVKALLQFTYQFSSNIKLDMYTLAYVSASSAAPGGALYTDGDLVLNQRNPITDRNLNTLYYNNMLNYTMPIGNTWIVSEPSSQLQFESILKSYLDHNYTTHYSNQYHVWKAGPGKTFELQVRLRIPPNQVIWYRPQVIEMLKFGWIQFVATFVVLWWLYSYLELFVFRYRLLETRVLSDVQPRTMKF